MNRRLCCLLLLSLLCGCTAKPTPSQAVSPAPTPSPSPAPLPSPPALEVLLTPPTEGELWGRRCLQVEYQDGAGKLLFEGDLVYPYLPEAQGGYAAIEAECQAWMDAGLEDVQLGIETGQVPLGTSCYLLSHGDISFCQGGLAQLAIYREGYLGGAHGFHSAFSFCYDLDTGETLTLSDLFTHWPTAKEAIWEALEPQVLAAVSADLSQDAAAQAYDCLEDTPFFLHEEGLTIHYNEYAIASYAAGSFDFPLSKDLLAPLTAYSLWD